MAVASRTMEGHERRPAHPDRGPLATAPSPELVRTQLARMLASRTFASAPSLSRFLSHVVEHTLQGQSDGLKEYSIGVDVFDRGPSFDPKIDTIVRVQARRLRAKVEEYYETEGRDDVILIGLVKGHYVPEFGIRQRGGGPWRHGLAEVHRLPVTSQAPAAAGRRRSRAVYAAAALFLLAAVALGSWRLMGPASGRPITDPSEYTQITDFTDSVTAPSLSPDGRMVTFIRGTELFLSSGQIYVKLLPDGEPRRLTDSSKRKLGPVFTPDGSRIAYSQVDANDWNTWMVPVLGGEPSLLLANASGLVWLDRKRVMFSEFKDPRPHLGLVTATESRAEHREIYFPSHVRGMAHYSYASPDRKWVLVVEMDGTGAFDRCRLVPFGGTEAGRPVGPAGKCMSAAWSPDGKWMYFSAEVGRQSHLWREPIDGGPLQQITFGPTDEEGVAVAPDGRSLITAIGQRQSAIWIHDDKGDRPLSSEGLAFDPRFSADGRRVYFLLQPTAGAATSELRSIDLVTGQESRLLEGIVREHDIHKPQYDVSPDEQEVVYSTRSAQGEFEVWLARLDRRVAPRLVAHRAAFPSFGRRDDLFFVALEERSSTLVRTRKNGSDRQTIPHHGPVINRAGVSPDGNWVVVFASAEENGPSVTLALPVAGGMPRQICNRLCWPRWSPDGTFVYVNVYDLARTFVIPLAPGQMLPNAPVDVWAANHEIPETNVIPHLIVAPGPKATSYVFEKTDVRRNLYRVPLH
jgi:eukaryotic-like serine/threonine-protein kinase